MSFSKPSLSIASIYVPKTKKLNADFVYNYYVQDESISINQKIPSYLKIKSSEQLDTSSENILSRIPRYVRVFWDVPSIKSTPEGSTQRSISYSFSSPGFEISKNLEKIATEDSVASSRFTFLSFSSYKKLAYAESDINGSISDKSQATIIDNYVDGLLSNFSQTEEDVDPQKTIKDISSEIQSIEKFADNPNENLGINFYDASGKEIKNISGFQAISQNAEPLYSKVNSLVLSDVFTSSSLSYEAIQQANSAYLDTKTTPASFEPRLKPVFVGKEIESIDSFYSSTSCIGYVLEKYELTPQGFVKVKTFAIENSLVNSYIDTEVKYGFTYKYSLRTVARLETFKFNKETKSFYSVTYYVGSNPAFSQKFVCVENVPPPPPIDINFVWDYKKSKLKIVWAMPVNSQRDIKQFQVFRRSSIDEPFELIRQKSFDFSAKKFETGEKIDGNKQSMSKDESSFIDYEKFPSMMHLDDDFVVDIENLSSSKYIYTVSSIDAHGLISNYGSQFEITFDFFKNKIVKKLISSSGAPRQYPNMYLDVDLFKDVIKTSGKDSLKMKIYFMPEYYNVKRANGTIEPLVSTKQKNSFYKIQFINLQNQKSDSLKVTIDDPSSFSFLGASFFSLL